MKTIHLKSFLKNLLVFLFIGLWVGCRKDPEVVKPLPRNSAEVFMNGKPWNGLSTNGTLYATLTVASSCWAEPLDQSYNRFFGISFYRYYNGPTERNYFQSLSLGAIPLKEGIYELKGNRLKMCRPDTIAAGAFYTGEYDTGGDVYGVLQSEENYIKVLRTNKQTGLVEGEIMATFIRVHGAKDSPYPDTMRFQPSRFYAFLGADQ